MTPMESSLSARAEIATHIETWFNHEVTKDLPPLDEGSLDKYLIAGGGCDYHSAQKRIDEECQGCLSARKSGLLILATLTKVVRHLQHELAECYQLSGADPDGNEDWRLAEYAVAEVRRMRLECDEMAAEMVAKAAQGRVR